MNKKEMLDSVRYYLELFGEADERILNAMQKIDRKHFINDGYAYLDDSFPIGYGQTVSQPSTVARMISLLELKESDNILEIGTGCGWNAALLGFIAKKGKVLSLEIITGLLKMAKKNIKKMRLKNVEIKDYDFRKLKGKFDKIIFTAGVSDGEFLEEYGFKHLEDKGIIVCPFQSGPLIIIRKENNEMNKRYSEEEYSFVPLIF